MKTEVRERINQRTSALQEWLVETRRDIYMHPELSGKEVRTAALVARELTRLGLAVAMTPDKTGVIGVLTGAKPGPTIAYRADMDALPMPDSIDRPYRSRVEGVKHGCGHDVHTTVALGVAAVLASLKSELPGTVKLIFQPAEETATGARLMLESGALHAPQPDLIFALHTSPAPVGTIDCNLGTAFWGLKLLSVSLEAARDELAQFGPALAEKLLRLCDVLPDGVQITEQDLTLGTERGFLLMPTGYGSVTNGVWEMRFIIKALDEQSFERALTAVATATKDNRAELQLSPMLPPVVNTERVARESAAVLSEVLGERNVNLLEHPISPLGSEDFAFYLEHAPGAIFWLGVANRSKGISGAIHTPGFDVDEDCLTIGTRAMAHLIHHYLEEGVKAD